MRSFTGPGNLWSRFELELFAGRLEASSPVGLRRAVRRQGEAVVDEPDSCGDLFAEPAASLR
jgi:hypothetical protein